MGGFVDPGLPSAKADDGYKLKVGKAQVLRALTRVDVT
jgi:hypothetical protein